MPANNGTCSRFSERIGFCLRRRRGSLRASKNQDGRPGKNDFDGTLKDALRAFLCSSFFRCKDDWFALSGTARNSLSGLVPSRRCVVKTRSCACYAGQRLDERCLVRSDSRPVPDRANQPHIFQVITGEQLCPEGCPERSLTEKRSLDKNIFFRRGGRAGRRRSPAKRV